MSFGNKLKLLRVSHKLDQETISKKLNISQPVYSRYENDEKTVSEETPLVKKVAEEFHVTAKWLLAPLVSLVADNAVDNPSTRGNYYHVPKDFMDALLRQQQMTERVLNLLSEKLRAG